MITNIFSVFDPSSRTPILNWVSISLVFILVPPLFWAIPRKTLSPWNIIYNKLNLEFRIILTPGHSTGVTTIVISVFTFIIASNLCGLTPYTFTATSHITTTLAISLPLWVGLILYGWLSTPTHILAHLIPQSTPGFLIPFIVLIETTSNLIRPATLAIRLTANIIAGHLLITLLGNQVASNYNIVIEPIIVLLPIVLVTLELAVAVIQSYVFSVLITLYSNEVTYDN